MISNLPYGLASSRIWRSRLSLVSVLIAGSLIAAPSPIDDEAFLLFLADSVERDGEWIDPLSMVEEQNENEPDQSEAGSDKKEADNE